MDILPPQTRHPASIDTTFVMGGLPSADKPAARKPVGENYAPLAHVCHLLNIDPALKEELCGRCHYMRFNSGEPIHYAGDPFSGIYIVADGSAKETLIRDGRASIVGLFLPGEIIGFEGFDRLVHTCTASAVSDLLLVWVPHKVLAGYCRTYRDFDCAIVKAFARQILDVGVLLETLGNVDALVKTAFFLFNLAVRTGTHVAPMTELRLHLTHTDVATYIGIECETLSRTLDALGESNLIRCEGDAIYINNIEQLQQICMPYSARFVMRVTETTPRLA